MLVVLLVLAGLWGPAPSSAEAAEGEPTAPASEDGAFRLAVGRREWAFPRDHGQHAAYRLEWWYYTGWLETEGGRGFGYQVTFFRRGIVPGGQARPSAWAVGALFAAQAAVSEPAVERFLHEGRASRDSLGMAGAAADGPRVWLGPWRVEELSGGPHDVRLSLPAEAFGLELTLRARREPVLHGQGGLDRKGEAAGDASWYYSLTRLETRGTLHLGGESLSVRGTTWMDHEFSSSQLGAQQVGWDWMGLRLDDGSDLMLYRLRREDGAVAETSGGSWVSPAGVARPLSLSGASGNRLRPASWWQSPASGARYPVAWQVVLRDPPAVLDVTPRMEAQEMPPTAGIPFPYWEGAVRVSGTVAGQPVRGEGFLELTGYGGDLRETLRAPGPAANER